MGQINILVAVFLIFLTPFKCYSQSFTIATQNLWHYTDGYLEREANFIKELDIETPDIFCFQEAFKYLNGKSLFNVFLSKSNYKAHYFATNNVLVMREGIANASHFPLGDYEKIPLPHGRMFSKRPMLISLIHTPLGRVRVINVHFTPFSDNHGKRIDQMKFLVNIIKKRFRNENVIVLGDFNQAEEDDQNFFDPLTSLGFEKTLDSALCTYCSSTNPYVKGPYNSKIDYIFFKPDKMNLVKARRFAVDNPISDHYGVLAEFR